jgi:bacillithiol biosynthesis deacetylase BshB1
METVDLLAIFPHPDDAELTCGGTLLKAASLGHRVGIVDLTAGELASRGTVAIRAQESAEAARVLKVSLRENLGLPDGGLSADPATRRTVALAIRRLKPRVVITTAPSPYGRHPDHRVTGDLVRDACYMAGLKQLDAGSTPHRPHKVLHCLSYREDNLPPTFIVDITDEFERKLEAVQCYRSQFEGLTQAGEVYPNGEPLVDIMRHQAAHYGSLIRTRYGEPFHTTETMRVDDVVAIDVATF